MNLQFLGTSSGVPTRQRNVSGLALNPDSQKAWYLVDCGEGTQHQLLRSAYSLHHLRAILITHLHGDHCYGLFGLLASAALSGRKQPLTVIAPQALQALLQQVITTTQLYLDYPLNFIAVETLTAGWQDDSLRIERIELSHRVPSFAYRFTEIQGFKSLNCEQLRKDGIAPGPVWGQLQRGEMVVWQGQPLKAEVYTRSHPPRCMVVAGDNDNPELLREACHNAQVLIHEATYTEADAQKIRFKPQHCSAQTIARFAAEVALPHLVLTHFSPRYQADCSQWPNIQQIAAEARQYYSGGLYLAQDFSRFGLTPAGVFFEVKPV